MMTLDKFGRHIETHRHKKLLQEINHLKLKVSTPAPANQIPQTSVTTATTSSQSTPEVTQLDLKVFEESLLKYIDLKLNSLKGYMLIAISVGLPRQKFTNNLKINNRDFTYLVHLKTCKVIDIWGLDAKNDLVTYVNDTAVPSFPGYVLHKDDKISFRNPLLVKRLNIAFLIEYPIYV